MERCPVSLTNSECQEVLCSNHKYLVLTDASQSDKLISPKYQSWGEGACLEEITQQLRVPGAVAEEFGSQHPCQITHNPHVVPSPGDLMSLLASKGTHTPLHRQKCNKSFY